MTDKEQKKAAEDFSNYWEGKGYEKGEAQKFWIDLLQSVFGIKNATRYIEFEDQVHIDKKTGFIDGYIPDTKVMIEQKSLGKSLTAPILQSDGKKKTPFQQAKQYIVELPVDKHPLWVITCNFAEFLIYDMNKPNGEPEHVLLKNLPKEYYRLQFIVEQNSEMLQKEKQISIEAGELVGKLYNALIKQYKNPKSPETLKSLNMLCVRLVFCLYAEDAHIFPKHEMFGTYLKQFQSKDVHKGLRELFKILNMTQEQRDEYNPYLKEEDKLLAAFPYVNGGLFTDDVFTGAKIEIPPFSDEIVDLLVNKASAGFDWSEISPTIFGAVFESTLNPETRDDGGMHYTSIENIHKVIDPLFLTDLRKELDTYIAYKEPTRKQRLREFHRKLSSLTFLDPACGSGNFLTETYISLRKLENELIVIESNLMSGQLMFDRDYAPIQVSINQFFGIEINDFAVAVAKTALWIAEIQMMQKTQELLPDYDFDPLPLNSNYNIRLANALRIDWNEVVSKDKLNYIMGNPPFEGARRKKVESMQKQDIKLLFKNTINNGNLDYVSGWYKKSAEIMTGTNIKTALVSTNSITQGEQVSILWNELFKYNVNIDFAHKTFIWNSEAKHKAHVHCVIIGFNCCNNENNKTIFDGNKMILVKHINPYLMAFDDILVSSHKKAICKVKPIKYGNVPGVTSAFVINEKEKDSILQKEPNLSKFIKPYIGADEFINGKIRYCFWLVEATPNELHSSNELLKRVKKVKEERENPKKPLATRKKAAVPHLFFSISQPTGDYIIIPKTSSENRAYIPVGFMPSNYIASSEGFIIPNGDIFDFGILTSSVHMAWVRVIGGKLKSDYRYSKEIVYNNFPWCSPTPDHKAIIEKTAQGILDARALYPDSSLAALYGEESMPLELRKAHRANDKAVMQAYGFKQKNVTESEIVAKLMKMYQKLTEK